MVKVRTRQDSGIYDGEIRGVLDDDPELYLIRWKKNVIQVIEEEASQMHSITQAFREEWDSKRGGDLMNEEELLIDWKMKIRESMELTRDLVECVSVQVIKSMEYSTDDVSYIKEERYSQWRPKGHKHDTKRIWKLLHGHGGRKEFQWDAVANNVKKMKKNEYFRTWYRNQLNKRRMAPRLRRFTQSEPEDIFWDWSVGCRPFEDDVDINKAFWNISLDSKRMRKLSEEIGDLPISDRPDIIHDRCEILEGFVETPKFASTPVAYWNIFRAWKHIFQEKSSRKKRSYRKCHAKKLKKLLLHTQVETYFEDWKHNLKDDFFYKRRSPASTLFYANPNMNMAQRLSAAFAHYMGNLKEIQKQENNDASLVKNVPYLRKEFEESHIEFCRLRRQIRVERQRSKSFRYIMNEEDWLSEWRWNFSEKKQWEDGLPSGSLQYFKEWSHNLDESKEMGLEHQLKKKLLKVKIEKSLPKREASFLAYSPRPCDYSHLRIEKMQRRKMNRIFAKQPLQRIYCH